MPDILIRDVDANVVANLKLAAKQRKISVARLVAEMLAQQFSRDNLPKYNDLDALAGTWSANDLRQFEDAIEPLTRVDEQMWKSPRRRK